MIQINYIGLCSLAGQKQRFQEVAAWNQSRALHLNRIEDPELAQIVAARPELPEHIKGSDQMRAKIV
jgi:hypothetical protein